MKAKRKAVYAASLDPITNGHINVIERTAPLYDELVVVVAVDSRKSYTFTLEERVSMTKSAVAHLPNVSVDVCVGQYVVKLADSIGAQVILRGLRNFKDLEAEQALAEENRKICPNIETVWIPCRPDLMYVSSSMVKGHVGVDPDWEQQVARSVPALVVTKLKEKHVISKARKHWASLIERLSLKHKEADHEEILKDLLTRYSEPARAYHNLYHIIDMLDELEGLDEQNASIELAIWFHDAVYETKSKSPDNEMKSALLAAECIQKMGLPISLSDEVSRLIMATAHACASLEELDEDSKLLIDLDLMILGKSEKAFDSYEAAIRKEYEWVTEPDFKVGRSKILRTFLDRASIYTTQLFREKYESTARKNLSRSIEMLRA